MWVGELSTSEAFFQVAAAWGRQALGLELEK